MRSVKNFFLGSLSTWIILIIFLLDRISKEWIQKRMLLGEPYEVFSFFHLSYVQNTGATFGIGRDQNSFFIITSILILGIIFFMRYRWRDEESQNLKLKSGLSLVIGGALGNLYDRIFYGYVIDFLDFFITPYHWPAFNIADSSICVGAFFLLFSQKGICQVRSKN